MGGVDEVMEEIQRDFPEVDIMDLKRDLIGWRLEQKAEAVAEAEKKAQPTQEEPKEVPDQARKEAEVNIESPAKPLPTSAAVPPVRSQVPGLQPQMRFKNRIVTAYRSAEGTCVLEYLPFRYLTVRTRENGYESQAALAVS